MTDNERLLVFMLQHFDDRNIKAILVQNYIAEFGPLSEECAKVVRELLA